ncbi:helix-turn-helix domain-containing protein [Pedobacter mucosus]|uniref:helix-turn-helix domain-containing protein n=1 Tax=Pedobacter mucosus TaxID=2895286 RepID=UPI001EE45FF7|nr:response regulator transcription factor [Pedobacter mucosus]UKT65020.1 helix-turn-helix transcriptional regulator [Pedobacter mucosus]
MAEIVELQNFYARIDLPATYADNGGGHFNIFRINDLKLTGKKRSTYSRRTFYKITLINGHSKIHYAEEDIEINGYALVFSSPSIQYHWQMISEVQRGYMCIFTEQFFSRFANIAGSAVFQSAAGGVIKLTEKQAISFERLLEKIFDELSGNYRYKYELLRCLLMEVVHEGQKMLPMCDEMLYGSNAAERIASLFTGLMEREYPIELTYQVVRLTSPFAFAQQLNIHVNHLNKALKAATGQTTSQLISQRILQEAKVLLKKTNWSIAEIACSLGFGEASHFSAFFKSLSGIRAKDYRALNRD